MNPLRQARPSTSAGVDASVVIVAPVFWLIVKKLKLMYPYRTLAIGSKAIPSAPLVRLPTIVNVLVETLIRDSCVHVLPKRMLGSSDSLSPTVSLVTPVGPVDVAAPVVVLSV